jgi:hypothetical protein
MRATSIHQPQVSRPLVTALRIAIVALTLATAQLHFTLGGLMFTLNALGYATLAAAMVLPGPIGRLRWLTRYALIGFIDKAIEAVLIGLLLVDSWVTDGGPLAVARRAQRDVAALLG